MDMVRNEQGDAFSLLDPATRAAVKASGGNADAAAGA
jgi:hypothetical protein